jgi:hypothetical protein
MTKIQAQNLAAKINTHPGLQARVIFTGLAHDVEITLTGEVYAI